MNRETLIAYLLHRMPEDERAGLAERSMTDPELYGELRMVEAELLDAYVRGEVSPLDRRLIDEHLLASESQRQKLAFAKALHTAMPAVKARQVRSWTTLAAAAALVMLAGSSAWLGLENSRLRRTVPQSQEPAGPTGSTYAAFIPSSAVRGVAQGPLLKLPSAADIVKLDVELEPGDEAESMSATVTVRGRPVWHAEPVRAVQHGSLYVAPLWIPASVLRASDAFDLTLEARGQPILSYHARIER